MAFTNTKESGLESLIVKWLVEQNGYEEGTNADYNKEYAVDETRLFRFLEDTQPKEMDKLGVFKSDAKKRQFLNRLSGEIAKRGIIDVLRNGVKVYPADLIMFYLIFSGCWKAGFGCLSVYQWASGNHDGVEKPAHKAEYRECGSPVQRGP